MYSLNNLEIFKKKYKLFKTLFFICLALILIILVLTLCFTNYKNYRYFEIIGGVLIGILVFLSILLVFRFTDYKRLRNHFESVLNENKKYIDAKVISINDKVITLDDNIRVKEIVLETKDNSATYYLLSIFDVNKLQVNKSYNILLADRFIREINYEI